MQAILKKLTKLILRQNKPINNNSPRRVIPDTRKLFWNDSTQRSIITRNATIIIAFLALTVNGLVYFTSPAFAEAGASFTFTVNVPSDPLLEIQLYDGDGTTSLQNAVSMDVVPGYYSAGFNEQDVTIKVATNNTWGYNLVMNVANTALTSGSNTIANLTTKTGGYTCTRETAATCDFTANSWGYKIKTATSDQAATNYIPVPNSITLNHNGQASDGDAATGGTTELAFASRIDATQAPGAYSTTINFIATANPAPKYTVTLASANTNQGTVSPNSVQVEHGTTAPTGSSNPLSLGGTSITATPSTGYNFSSWTSNCGAEITGACTVTANFTKKTYTVTIAAGTGGKVSPTSIANVPHGTSVAISNNAVTINGSTSTATANSGYEFNNWTNNCGSTVTSTCTITANFKLPTTFAQAYNAAGKSMQSGYYKMQDMTPTICAEVSTNQTTQLLDTRDNKIYWVSKLADGNCWMTQNLDYNIKATGNEVAVIGGTTTTWDSPNGATSTSVFNSSSNTGTYSYDPGSKYLPNGTGSATAITCTSASNGGENCHYHLGNYYQWNAATAGSGGSITNADATTSICPKGWRLPTSNSYTNNYSFGKLTNAYGITNSADGSSDAALLSSPLWFVRAGYVVGGFLNYQGSDGYVWSSRAYSYSYRAYYLYFFSSFVNPSYGNNRNLGFSVRCVAE